MVDGMETPKQTMTVVYVFQVKQKLIRLWVGGKTRLRNEITRYSLHVITTPRSSSCGYTSMMWNTLATNLAQVKYVQINAVL